MKSKSIYPVLAMAAGVFATTMPEPAEAANTLARVVSRANCLVPLPRLSLIQSGGRTFNESISWDPVVWSNHRAQVRSKHYRSVFWGGFWSDYMLNYYDAGDLNAGTWRVWAGTIVPGDTREMPNPNLRPVRFVSGGHWELLDGSRTPDYTRTDAVDCNITTW